MELATASFQARSTQVSSMPRFRQFTLVDIHPPLLTLDRSLHKSSYDTRAAPCVCVCVCVRAHTHTHIYIYLYISQTHIIHAHAHTHTHTHVHTHTHT